MKSVYVITGTRGGYSDWQRWIVGVCTTKEEAQIYQERASEWKDVIVAQYRGMNYAPKVRGSREFRERCGKYDSELVHNLSADVEYWIDEVPLLALAKVKDLQ